MHISLKIININGRIVFYKINIQEIIMGNHHVEALGEEAKVEEMEVDIPTIEIPVNQDNNNNDMKVINMTTPQINLHLI